MDCYVCLHGKKLLQALSYVELRAFGKYTQFFEEPAFIDCTHLVEKNQPFFPLEYTRDSGWKVKAL